MITLKKAVISMIKTVFYLIPVTAVVAFILWFFGHVVFSMETVGFLNTWKGTYITSLVVAVTLDSLGLVKNLFEFYSFSKKIGVPMHDVEDAWWNYKFYKKHGKEMFTWTKEMFEENYGIAKMATGMAKVLVDALFR